MKASIVIGGDYYPNLRLKERIQLGEGLLIWHDLDEIIKKSDLSIINLEAPVIKKGFKPISKAGPSLNCNSESVALLKTVGIDMVTLANNHIMDYGELGYKETIECLTCNDIDYLGAGENLKKASTYTIKEIKDKKIGILNACETEFSIASENTPGCRPLDLVSILEDLRNLKNEADYIVMIIHGGHEHYQLPSPRMKKLYNFFINNGANIIINHHQHCYSGYEEINGNYIFYGLGNLCFDNKKKSKLWTEGYLVKINIQENGLSPEIIPYKQCREEPKICLLTGTEKKQFEEQIINLNAIIKNQDLLTSNFNSWIESNRMRYVSNLSPLTSKIFRGLIRYRIIPSFLSKKRKNMLYDGFFCESHRDILKSILHGN